MRGVRRLPALLIACQACGLFPSLDGLSTPNEAGHDASADGPVSTSKYRAAVMADSPVGYWRLGDATPAVAADEIGAHPGTGIGTDIAAGVPGALANDPDTAFHFGSQHTSYIDIGDFFAFPGTPPYSLELWARMVDDGNYKVFISKDDATNGSPDIGYEVFADTSSGSGKVYFRRYGASAWNTITQPLPYGVWTYIVATYDGVTLSFYVNGAVAAGSAMGGSETTSTSHLVFAGDVCGSGSHFEGDLDEVAIYDKALDAARIAAHWQAAQ
jgi:hypothetical protein